MIALGKSRPKLPNSIEAIGRNSRHSLRECGVKLQNPRDLLEIHATFAERTTTMVSKVDGIEREPPGFATPDASRPSAKSKNHFGIYPSDSSVGNLSARAIKSLDAISANRKWRHPRRRFAYVNLSIAFWIVATTVVNSLAMNILADEPVRTLRLNVEAAADVQLQGEAGAVVPPNAQEEAEVNRTLRVELAFLRRAVQLTAEQDQQLSGFDASQLESIRVKQRKVAPGVNFVEVQAGGGAVGQVRIAVANGASDPLRIRQIERAFAKEVDSVLTEDQKAAYAAEKKCRDAFYQETAILGMLLLLDKRLSLSNDQSQNIRTQLATWNEMKLIDITPYFSAVNFLPPIPDSLLVNHLNESQREILKHISKINISQQAQRQQQFNGDIFVPR